MSRNARQAVNLDKAYARIDSHWQPGIVAELNGQHVKLAKVKGEFVWHSHEHEDEMFYVIRGELTMQLRQGDVRIGPGELYVVPKGVEHCPRADEETWIMLVEPISTLNTGQAESDLTVAELDWLVE